VSTETRPERGNGRAKRAAILAAAREALVAGDGDIEMADVARRADVSVGLAYHHFGSKAGLVAALVTAFYDRYDAVVNQRFAPALSWPERESLRLRCVVDFLFADPEAPAVLGRLGGSAEVVAVEAARRAAIIEFAARNIRKGQERGAVAPWVDPDFAAAAINGGLREAIAQALRRPDRPEPATFARAAWGFVAGALALPGTRLAGAATVRAD